MAKAPAVQFYPGDRLRELMPILADSEAVGAWCKAWMYLWDAGPSGREVVAAAAGKGWERVGFLFAEKDGLLYLDWMEQKRAELDAFRARQSENGKQGGRGKRKSSKREKPSLSSGLPKQKPRRSPRVEDGDREEEHATRKEHAEARRGPDPGIQAVIDHLSAALKVHGIAQSLDKSERDNRYAAHNLIVKLGKDYPDFDAVVSAKHLINAAMEDPFHRNNATSVRYLYDNCAKIAAAAKARKSDPKNQTSQDRDQQFADAVQRRAADRAATA